MPQQYKIGITLSGGGARGIAHIGVLKALQEHHIFPEIISATSAGSIIGAFYAAGLSPEQMLNIAKSSSLISAFRPQLPFSGLMDLKYLRKLLEEHIGQDDFAALKKPLHVAVTNLNSGKLEILDQGSLYDAVTASSSIPLVFKPVIINEQKYADGGLINNFPTKDLRPLCQHLIGVNVMPIVYLQNNEIKSLVEIGTRTFELSIYTNTLPGLQYCDWVIEPTALKDYHIFKFSEAEAIYEIGYQAAMEQIPEILKELL